MQLVGMWKWKTHFPWHETLSWEVVLSYRKTTRILESHTVMAYTSLHFRVEHSSSLDLTSHLNKDFLHFHFDYFRIFLDDHFVNFEVPDKFIRRNFRKLFHKGNRFGRGNRFGNGGNRFGKGRGNSFGNKGGESLKPKGACYNCGIEGQFASECRKPKENKAFMGGAWSDSEDGDEQPNDATCLMAIDS
ncbi:retrovirus-related pol polyprotein from transposon TNT 1-94 [Tanacetum coccineum]|uniref:Retrovirus-related pol polyprotein from transposon TNT 1-94 n=1 Tax=Tanacetum coccineum TaxID=301880 RepID=A0ABQ5GU32_9ASTR